MIIKKTTIKKILAYLFKMLISGGLIWYILTEVPIADIKSTLRDTHFLLYGIALVFSAFLMYLAALQFRVLNLPFKIDLTTFTIIKVNLITSFYSLFLPGYLAGGAVKWIKMQKYAKRPAELFITIILNRFIELGSLFIVGVIFMVPYLLDKDLYGALWILLALSVAIILMYCCAFSKRMLTIIESIVARMNFLPAFFRKKVDKLCIIVTNLHELPRSTHIHIVVNCLGRQLIGIGALLMIARSVHIPVLYGDIAWMRSVVIILGMLPISIGNLGVREASIVVMMEQFGVVPALALSYSFLILLMNVLFSFIGGVLDLIDKPQQGDN